MSSSFIDHSRARYEAAKQFFALSSALPSTPARSPSTPVFSPTQIAQKQRREESIVETLLQEWNSTADVELRVCDTSLRAHKNLLSAFSPVFRTLLASNSSSNQTINIEIQDASVDCFKHLLVYCYSGIVQSTPEILLELRGLAELFQIPALLSGCAPLIAGEDLTAENCCAMLEHAKRHKSEAQLMPKLLSFVEQHLGDVALAWCAPITKLSMDSLIQILSSPYVAQRKVSQTRIREEDLLRCVLQWLASQRQQATLADAKKLFAFVHFDVISLASFDSVKEHLPKLSDEIRAEFNAQMVQGLLADKAKEELARDLSLYSNVAFQATENTTEAHVIDHSDYYVLDVIGGGGKSALTGKVVVSRWGTPLDEQSVAGGHGARVNGLIWLNKGDRLSVRFVHNMTAIFANDNIVAAALRGEDASADANARLPANASTKYDVCAAMTEYELFQMVDAHQTPKNNLVSKKAMQVSVHSSDLAPSVRVKSNKFVSLQ